MSSFDVVRVNTTPVNYVYKEEVPVTTAIQERAPIVVQHVIPSKTLEDVQQPRRLRYVRGT
jgi:hypothetical protein